MTAPPKEIKRLSRFLTYVLGIRPDEFGLVPDDRGFVATKALLKALRQETGWRHLRMGHLEQLVVMLRPAPIEIQDRFIRAESRDRLPAITIPEKMPKLLYVAIRRRAYTTVLEHGLSAGSDGRLILSSDRAMAQRMGARLDNHFVLLTVQVARSQSEGTFYRRYGETLYLTDTLLPGTFTGPPLPKEKAPAAAKIPEKETAVAKTPGSYFPDFADNSDEKKALKRERRHRKIALEKERRQARKNKSRGKF